jgi:transcriptional regulator with XRE-family HTH domain
LKIFLTICKNILTKYQKNGNLCLEFAERGLEMLSNLIEWERANGYKANFVAEKLGLSPSQYSLIKHGKNKPTVGMAEKLQSEFGVDDPIELLKNT